ncbi:MAG: biopolymer transporter ExbD [Candidatus Gastranaerophilales bacterium]|nr:biopolymer transporter ExbD [Candidatus Gastranaerophilales bacterium]
MAIKTTNSKKKAVFSEINITPLTDIFLVLLIIMMVVAPTFQSNVNDINIPEINSGLAVEEKAATVSITKDGDYYLNGKPIALEELTDALIELKPLLKKAEVLVKADTAAKSRDIMQVMRAAKDAEFEKLTVAGEPLSKKEQKELEKKAEVNDSMPQTDETVQVNVVETTDEKSTGGERPYADKPAVQKTEKSDFSNTDWEE